MATISQKTPTKNSSSASDTSPINSAAPAPPQTYLQELNRLEPAYPALKGIVKASLYDHAGGKLVEDLYQRRHQRPPGRCAVLKFNEEDVTSQIFEKPGELQSFLDEPLPAGTKKPCRLYILEDLQNDWMNLLGDRLGVDPLVFSEQMNTWHYTDSQSIPTRQLPSMVKPEKSFTLRYYEVRQLKHPRSISHLSNQMTFAVNRRRYERWRDVDTPSLQSTVRYRHGFIRRCASFWTNQRKDVDGWDSVILVDPAFESFKWGYAPGHDSPNTSTCTILQDHRPYASLAKLWKARAWEREDFVREKEDTSLPYHSASTTFADASSCHDDERKRANVLKGNPERNLSSPLDEIVFHWTKVAEKDLITDARTHAVNSSYYLLKYLGNAYVNLLELIACGVAESEFYADDHQANIDSETREDKSAPVEGWRDQLKRITSTTKDIHYQKRQMSNFQSSMVLNLERLAVGKTGNKQLPQAIEDAQMDFQHLSDRLQPYVDRVSGLTNVANDLANLHTAFRSIKDSERGLRLSLFASVVFPMTLVTSMLSMGEDFLPGKKEFWVFWAASVPLVMVTAAALLLGSHPRTFLKEQFVKLKSRRVPAEQRT